MDGWLHPDGRRIYALSYWLDTPPPASRQLVVWLTEDGYATFGARRPDGRPIVVTKPGDVLRLRDGNDEYVLAVEVHIGSGTTGHGKTALSDPATFKAAIAAGRAIVAERKKTASGAGRGRPAPDCVRRRLFS